MSETIPFKLPARFSAGSTVIYRREIELYPAPTWSLTLFLNGKDRLEVAASADEAAHLVQIDPGDPDGDPPFVGGTGSLRRGVYRYLERVTDGDKVVDVDRGTVTVLANLATAAAGDLQPFAERAVEALEAALGNALTRQRAEFEIDGVHVAYSTRTEGVKLLAHYRAELAALRRPRTFGRPVILNFRGRG